MLNQYSFNATYRDAKTGDFARRSFAIFAASHDEAMIQARERLERSERYGGKLDASLVLVRKNINARKVKS